MFINAKKDLYKNGKNMQRTMSNNSVTFVNPPSREQFHPIFEGKE